MHADPLVVHVGAEEQQADVHALQLGKAEVLSCEGEALILIVKLHVPAPVQCTT